MKLSPVQLAIAVPVGLAAAAGGGIGGFQLTRKAELNDLFASKYQQVEHTSRGTIDKARAHSANITTCLEVGLGAATAGLGYALLRMGPPTSLATGLRTAVGAALVGGGVSVGVGSLFGNSLYAGAQLHS